jgi:uncharacterized protein (UPF0264 family)
MAQKAIVLKMKLSGGNVIPNGVTETLQIAIKDEVALFKFQDSKTTRKFVLAQKEAGIKSRYNERLQSCICHYPNLMQKELSEKITKSIKAQEKLKDD